MKRQSAKNVSIRRAYPIMRLLPSSASEKYDDGRPEVHLHRPRGKGLVGLKTGPTVRFQYRSAGRSAKTFSISSRRHLFLSVLCNMDIVNLLFVSFA